MQAELEPLSFDQAQQIHDLARGSDPKHDDSSCWCCCWDCDTDELWIAVTRWELKYGTAEDKAQAQKRMEGWKKSRGEDMPI